MIKVKLLKPYDGRKRGEFISIKRNEAHALIEQGVVTIKSRRPRKKVRRGYSDKMMTPQRYKRR